MNWIFTLCLLFSSTCFGYENDELNMYKDHYKIGQYFDIPKIDFFEDKNFKGTPSLTIDSEKVIFKNKIICDSEIAKSGAFYYTAKGAVVNNESGYLPTYKRLKKCKGLPIIAVTSTKPKSDFPDGNYTYFLEIENVDKKIISIHFMGRTYYAIEDVLITNPNSRLQESLEKRQKPKIEKIVKSQKFEILKKEIISCINKKDISCLAKHTKGYKSLHSGNNDRFGDGDFEELDNMYSECEGEKLFTSEQFAKCIIKNQVLVDIVKDCLVQNKFPNVLSFNQRIFSLRGKKYNCEFDNWQLDKFFPAKLLRSDHLD